MRTIIMFLFFLLFYLPVHGQALGVQFQNTIDSIYKANPESIGIMLHVESPDQAISWSGAVGYSNKILQSNIAPDQPALIASCTKSYVSAAILRLVEEKKIEINQPIRELVSNKTRILFESDGYDFGSITLLHLLAHTSGIEDYVNEDFFGLVLGNPEHRWTRDEQLELAIKVGEPLAKSGQVFKYADTNYLLLSEIIENLTGSPFYEAIRELLYYDALGLNDTWFYTLEDSPKGKETLVQQHWGDLNSFQIDVSSDLYGGGGIACTTKDLAVFSYNLFNGKIIKDVNVLNLIFAESQTIDSVQSNYHLGLFSYKYRGLIAYGHPGFWGTDYLYIPSLKTSISVYVLEKNRRELNYDVMDKIIGLLLQ